jgi:hypothetical protein
MSVEDSIKNLVGRQVKIQFQDSGNEKIIRGLLSSFDGSHLAVTTLRDGATFILHVSTVLRLNEIKEENYDDKL